jgi:hypothetical protein
MRSGSIRASITILVSWTFANLARAFLSPFRVETVITSFPWLFARSSPSKNLK